MNATTILKYFLLICLIEQSTSNSTRSYTPRFVDDQIVEDVTFALELDELEDEKILNYNQESCQCQLEQIPIDLPENSYWPRGSAAIGPW